MDDGDGGLSFDFEGGLDSAPAAGGGGPVPSSTDPGAGGGGGGDGPGMHGRGRGRGSYRQTVCRHWLRGLCMKGEACGFLHQFDKARMPVCRFFRDFGECREPDCAYKHSYDDVKECNMYKMGFCPNGPSTHQQRGILLGTMEGPPGPSQAMPVSGDAYCNSSPAPAAADAAGSSSPAVAKLRKLLFRRMLIGVNDGRYFLGLFHCIDKQGNIILQDAVEYRGARHSPAPIEQRGMGLILIPAACRSSCQVDCSVEEKMSLLCLE